MLDQKKIIPQYQRVMLEFYANLKRKLKKVDTLKMIDFRKSVVTHFLRLETP